MPWPDARASGQAFWREYVKVDLHVHTRYSPDSLTRPRESIRWAQRRGLDALAITDHNTVEAALLVAEDSPILVIVGEEILTQSGEIIGLFLREEIASGQSVEETVRCIKDQGGLVYVPHPMDRLRNSALDLEALVRVIEHVDVVEVLNARVTFSVDNRLAASLARAYDCAQGAGSDAHQAFEVGTAFVEMPPFHDAVTFMRGLRHGRVHGRISSPLVHIGSTYAKVAKELLTFSPFGH